jgi:hypothetical protein
MTALVVFDIEAVPDFEMARRLLARADDTPDADIRRMLGSAIRVLARIPRRRS